MMDAAAKNKRCSIFYNATTYRALEDCDQDLLKKVDNITILILGIVVIIIIGFAIAIIYYNLYVRIFIIKN